MNDTRIIKNIITVSCLLILLFLGINADHVSRPADKKEASSIDGFYFDGSPSDGIYHYQAVDSIQWFEQSGEYYLFLPAGIDAGKLAVYIEADGYVRTADGERLNSGYQSISKDEKQESVMLYAGEKEYRLHYMQANQLDSFFMDTDSGSMDYIHEDEENQEEAYLLAVGANQRKIYDGVVSGMKGRGNSTWACAKKSYTVKLSREADLLQNEKMHKNWVLQANSVAVEFEESLLRNAVALSLAQEIDETGNSIRYRFVNLYLNGVYTGLYQLCEKIQVGDNGIGITNAEKQMKTLNSQELFEYGISEVGIPDEPGHRRWSDIPSVPQDITGGYLLEMDGRYLEEPNGFETGRKNEFAVKSPKYCGFAQMGYIADRIQDTENAIYASDGINEKGYSYLDYIDLETFAEYYALSELLINPDTYRYSTFLYKDIDTEQGFGKIYAGPAWDFDRCAGGVDETQDYQTLFLKKRPWLVALREKEEFQEEVKRIYREELRPLVLYMAGEAVEAPKGDSVMTLSGLAEGLEPSAKMNRVRWAGHLPSDVIQEAHEISEWLINRISWLDTLGEEALD